MDKQAIGREKYWSEIDDAKKIERLREQVRYLTNRTSNLASQVRELRHHDHCNGKTVIGINDHDAQSETAFTPRGKGKDDVYL